MMSEGVWRDDWAERYTTTPALHAEHVVVHTDDHWLSLPPHRTQALLQGMVVQSGGVVALDGNEYVLTVWPPSQCFIGRATQISYSRTVSGFTLYRTKAPAPLYVHPHDEAVVASIRGFLRLFPGWTVSAGQQQPQQQVLPLPPTPTLLLSCSKGTGVRTLLYGAMQTMRPSAQLIVLCLGRVRACGGSRAGLLLRQLLAQSCLHSPHGAVVYLDGLESVFRGTVAGEEEEDIEDLLGVLEDFSTAAASQRCPVLLVGRVLSLSGLSRRQQSLWHQTLVIPQPSLDDRLAVVRGLLGPAADSKLCEELALSLSGLPLAETVRRASAAVKALAGATPHAAVDVAQCFGHERIKARLDDLLLLPRRCGPLLTKLGLVPETGALLYGPPGTGKTLLVRRLLQRHAGYRLIVLRLVDVIRGEVGAGEKAVVAAFAEAKRVAPSVLFIDEFQALFVSRGDDSQDRGFQSLSSALAGCFDDLGLWNGHAGSSNLVSVVAATNEPWSIDRGFLRPGRFDRLLYVGPLEREERRNFFMQAFSHPSEVEDAAGAAVDALLSRTEGYSGADLELVLLNARKLDSASGKLTLDALHQTVLRSTPTSSPAELAAFRAWEIGIAQHSLL